MKIRLLSDLHLEICNIDLKEGEEDIVVLAGDILPGGAFEWARETFPNKLIFYVSGNHELYNLNEPMERSFSKFKEEAFKYGVVYLDRFKPIILYPGTPEETCLVGDTLWTDFKIFEPLLWQGYCREVVSRGLNDYYCIGPHGNRLKTKETLDNFEDTIKQISKFCEYNKKIVVVTHHAPSLLSCLPKYKKDPITAGFASNLDSFIKERPQIKLWLHGHVHNSNDYMIGETRVVSNPRGYARLQAIVDTTNYYRTENPNFNPDLIIEV